MSAQQKSLFDPGPAGGDLTPRQRQVLAAIGRDGITAYEAGKAAGAGDRWAATTGRDILRALKRKGLVVERRNPPRFELARNPRITGPGELPESF